MADPTKQPKNETSKCSPAKAEGALLASAAGDALGWPQEFPHRVVDEPAASGKPATFREWRRRSGGRFFPHEEPIKAGEYSDDTQLTLAVARCRQYAGNSWWRVWTHTELPLWTLYERGGGGATKRAANLWAKGTPPWKSGESIQQYFNAGGNGVAMRALPHSIFYSSEDDPALLVKDVVLDGVATHGHPRALVGATAYAFAAWWLLRSDHTIQFGELAHVLLDQAETWGTLPASSHPRNGWLTAANHHATKTYESLWAQTVEELRTLLQRALRGLETGALADDEAVLRDLGCFGKAKGAGTVSTAAAVYLCARYAAQPVQAVLRAAFSRGADTDTIAAMSGGLVGCLAGKDWLPREWDSLQDRKYLQQVACELSGGPSATKQSPEDLHAVERKDLTQLRSALFEKQQAHLHLGGHRQANVVKSLELKPLSNKTSAKIWHLQTTDGQTLYITQLKRAHKEQRPRTRTEESSRLSSAADAAAQYTATAEGLKVVVRDLKAMVAFYEGVLGLRAAQRDHRFVSYGALSLVDSHTTYDPTDPKSNFATPQQQHLIRICVRDLDHTYRQAQKQGSKPERPRARRTVKENVFFCTDPEGNRVEVAERR